MADATAPAPHPTVKPMQGIRVIDVSSFLAGPFCSTQLGRVRCRGHQDRAAEGRRCPAQVRHHHESRRFAPLVAGVPQQEVGHARLEEAGGCRDPEAAGRPGRCSRRELPARHVGGLGLGWEVLKKPIHNWSWCAYPASARRGPIATRPGFGRIANAFGGISYLAGYPDRRR